MRTSFLGWLGGVALLGSGCATITAGASGTQRLDLVTDPPGATASAGSQQCTTPCSLLLPRRNDASVLLAGEGRAPQEVRLRSRLRLAAAADALYLPLMLPFLGVDLATGAAWELVPPDVHLALEPASPAAPGSPRPPLTLAPRPERVATIMLELGGPRPAGRRCSASAPS
jgi:hypothetical protein